MTLVLIADPKQAIYAFRGADVYAYLDAAARRRAPRDAGRQPAQRPAAARRRSTRCSATPSSAIPRSPTARSGPRRRTRRRACSARRSARALRVRVVQRDQPRRRADGAAATPRRPRRASYVAQGPGRRRRRAAVLAAPRSSAGPTMGRRSGAEPVAPGDIAVLVRSHRNADLIQRELAAAGVPAVINGAGSVFATAAARRLAARCSRRSSGLRTRRGRASAALTPLLGWSAERVALAGRSGARAAAPAAARMGARAAAAAASPRSRRRSRAASSSRAGC